MQNVRMCPIVCLVASDYHLLDILKAQVPRPSGDLEDAYYARELQSWVYLYLILTSG